MICFQNAGQGCNAGVRSEERFNQMLPFDTILPCVQDPVNMLLCWQPNRMNDMC